MTRTQTLEGCVYVRVCARGCTHVYNECVCVWDVDIEEIAVDFSYQV
jgi:hypothetical protein